MHSGTPTRFTLVYELDGQKTIRFNRFPATDKLRVEYPHIPIPADLIIATFLDANVNTSTDVITAAAHGLVEGQGIQFETTGALPAGLAVNTTYFASTVTVNTFKVATVQNDTSSEIDITAAAGTGTHTVSSVPLVPKAFRKVLQYAGSNIVHIDKSDSRADLSARQTQSTLQAMVTANRKVKRHTSKNKARLTPRMDSQKLHNRNFRPRIFS